MIDELVDVFDEFNQSLNAAVFKTMAHAEGLWHRVVHAWIYNSKYKLLLQLRSKNKDLFPNMYDASAGGHIGKGETPLNSIVRELDEELGLTIKDTDLVYYGCFKHQAKYKDSIHNQFCYTYFLRYDKAVESLVLQKSEVEHMKFISLNKIYLDLIMHPEQFVPYGSYWDLVINGIKNIQKNKC